MQRTEASDEIPGRVDAAALDCHLASCERILVENDAAAAKQEVLALAHVIPRDERQWRIIHSLCLKADDRVSSQVFTERFLAICRDNAEANLASAEYFARNHKDREKIRAAIEAALRSPGDSAEYWRRVTKLQSFIEEHENVLASARRALTFEPSDTELREVLVLSHAALRRHSSVRKECDIISRAFTESGVVDPARWAKLARIAAQSGAIRQAKIYIDQTTKHLSQVNYYAEFELIYALLLTKQPARVMPHMEILLVENTPNIWIWETILDAAMKTRGYAVALKAIARMKAPPNADPELLHKLNTKEDILRRKSIGFSTRISRWLSS